MPILAEKEYCTGCTACASACPGEYISMIADEDGFSYPQIDTEQCIGCGLCEKICPVLRSCVTETELPQAYAAYSKDESIRMESSSGGVFTELAKRILHEGGVVFGAAYNERFEVNHICIEQEKDLCRLRGAKYAQSNLDGIFTEIKIRLQKDQLVLFSGTPCQVAGLKAYLQRKFEKLITVDFVCHSVPSPRAWREYVHYRAKQDHGGKLPVEINLRSKITGWSRYQYSNMFLYEDGSTHIAGSGDSLYMRLFVGGFISRNACEHCRFKGYDRVSDLTVGDFWGIWDIAPEMDDNKGTSIILVQSEQGAVLLEKIADSLVLRPVSPEEASRQNPAMVAQIRGNDRKHEAMKRIRSGKIDACRKLLEGSQNRILSGIKRQVGRLLRGGNE